MKYYFKEELKTIEIMPERWAWGVIYKDGTELKQFGDDGQFHQFGEIDQQRVGGFIMYMLEDMTRRIDIKINDNNQIFHFYRNFILNAGTEDEQRIKAYCFGYKNKDTKQTAYHYILPNDQLIISDKDIDLFGISQ